MDVSPSASPATARPAPLSSELMQALEYVERDTWSQLSRLTPPEEARTTSLSIARIGSAAALVASGIDVLGFNRVVGLGLETPATEAEIDEIIALYRAAGVPRFFVQVSPAAASAALSEWLAARGFVHYNNWARLYRGVEEAPEATTDLRIERAGPEHAETIAAMTAAAFGWPSLAEPVLARIVGSPGWRHYLAFDGERPVATAALYASGNRGYLGPAATRTDSRKRGAQSAFIARRIRDAAALGCTLLVTETAEDRPERRRPPSITGFQAAYLRPNYLLRAPYPTT